MSGHDLQPDDRVQTVRQPFGEGDRPRPPFTTSLFTLLLGLIGLIVIFAIASYALGG